MDMGTAAGEARFIADEWLGERLGKPAYHLSGRPADLGADQWAMARSVTPVFLDAKIAVDDRVGAGLLVQAGFSLIDTLLTFDAPIGRLRHGGPPHPGLDVGFVLPAEESAVVDIAGAVFGMDRYYRDPMISKAAASRMKRDWAANYFRGQRGRWMVVARDGGRVVGFLQLLYLDGRYMFIDLIAVAPSHMGQGVGKAMIAYAVDHCPDVDTVIVGTQAVNIPAARLYETMGFRLTSLQHVFHCHGGGAAIDAPDR